jgi:hypothetical protein
MALISRFASARASAVLARRPAFCELLRCAL